MTDTVEKPPTTVLPAIGKGLTWGLVILATWGAGLYAGASIASRTLTYPHYVLEAIPASFLLWLIYPAVLLGLGVSAVTWYLPMKIESRNMAIGSAIVNTLAWTGVGMYLAWPSPQPPV